MDYLYVCNTASDYISKINLDSFLEEEKIVLDNNLGKTGPHGICSWKSDLLTANSYSNSISKIDMVQGIEVGSYYIGTHCNDIEVLNNIAYITCGELNNIVAFDLQMNKIIEEIPCGNFPHSIAINKSSGLIAVANMWSDSITVIREDDKESCREIKVGAYPTKCIFSRDNKMLFVCESNLGSDKPGSILGISLENLQTEFRITAGKGPVDMCFEDKMCYVSNFSEGTVSILYLQDREQVKKMYIGGMPRGILNKGRHLFIGDNYSNRVIRCDIYNERKKIIPIGGEPTGMVIV